MAGIQAIGGLGHLGVQFAAKLGFYTVAISRGVQETGRRRNCGALSDLPEALADMALREEIPAASPKKRGHRNIPVALYLAPKVALYIALRESGLSNLEFAKKARQRRIG